MFSPFSLIKRIKCGTEEYTVVNSYVAMMENLRAEDQVRLDMQKQWQRFRWEPYPSKIEWKEN